jgi:Fic family protein
VGNYILIHETLVLSQKLGILSLRGLGFQMKDIVLPPKFLDVINQQWASIIEANEVLVPRDRYLHWDEVRRVEAPKGISHEAWWAALKLARAPRLHTIGLRDRRNRCFKVSTPEQLNGLFHRLDRIEKEGVFCGQVGDQLATNAGFEECIGSAALAGVKTMHAAAKEMLRAGRDPGDESEQVIHNLCVSRQFVQKLRDQALSPEIIRELHRLIMEGLLEETAAGRFRRHSAGSPLLDTDRGVCHEPPPAEELPGRLDLLCAFANDQVSGEFLHPVVRASILHFWLAYERPFIDGNGRTARMLFHWAMLHQGYHVFDLLSVSSSLARAPERYTRSFMYTETDDNDLTYFVIHQAEMIQNAMTEMNERKKRKTEEIQDTGRRLRGYAELNSRQQALIAHALRKPGARYMIAGHQRSHAVTHQTARDDLFDLVRRELLEVGKDGRTYVFRAVQELPRKLQASAGRRRVSLPPPSTDLPTNLL